MTGGVADLLQVVVLATRPDALLAGDRTRIVTSLQTLKHALELHHAGIGEQQRGVIRGDQARAGDFLVRAGLEEVKESAANIGGLHPENIACQAAQLKGRI